MSKSTGLQILNKIFNLLIRVFIGSLIAVTLVTAPFVIPMIQNNFILYCFAKQLYDLPLPPDTTVIARTKDVGNLGPTGNHLDFAAKTEVRSRLSETALSEYYRRMSVKSANDVSFLKLDTEIYDEKLQHSNIEIEVIPKNVAETEYGSSTKFTKGNQINAKIDGDLFIIQILDDHYAPGWDIRAH